MDLTEPAHKGEANVMGMSVLQVPPALPSLGADGVRGLDPAPSEAVIVAVIPAYNEERFIASVVIKTRRYASHVIVVDDGSSDNTADLAELAGAEVVRQPKNGGKAVALNEGLARAMEHLPNAIVCLDGDAQHRPEELCEVAKPVLEGHADVVIGSRFLATRSAIPRWRQMGQHALTAVTNLTSGVKITDSQSGYRAFSPKAVPHLHFHTSGLSVESEMQFLFKQAGLKVAEVPISVSYLDGNKRNPVVHGIQILDAILTLVARRKPLLFFALPGLLTGCMGLFLGVRVTWAMENSGELLVGSAILTTLLLIGGLLLAVSGIMLHSLDHFVRRIREEMRSGLKLTSLRVEVKEPR